MHVLVPSWFSTTAGLGNGRGPVAVVPSPSTGQMGLLKGLTREMLALCLSSHNSSTWAGQGRILGCGFPSLVPTPSVQLPESFGLIQPRAIYLDLNNNKKHIVKAVSVLTVKHSHIITIAQQQ